MKLEILANRTFPQENTFYQIQFIRASANVLQWVVKCFIDMLVLYLVFDTTILTI